MTFSPQLVATKLDPDDAVLCPRIIYGKARWFPENFIETLNTKQSQIQITLNFKPVRAGLSLKKRYGLYNKTRRTFCLSWAVCLHFF